MNFGQYSYLITTAIFALSAVLIEWGLSFDNLWKRRRVIEIVCFICILGGVLGENTAIKWRVWLYNPKRIFNIYFLGIPVETYLWTILVVIAVSSATIIWSDYEEQNLPLARTTWSKLAKKFKKKV